MALTVYRFATGRELWKLGFPGGNFTPADRRFQPGQVSAVAQSGASTGKVKVTGLPTDTMDVRLQIMSAGNLGTATFRDTLDGGTTWGLTKLIPTDGLYTLPETGLVVQWVAGLTPHFLLNDVFSFTTVESSQSTLMAQAVSGRMARKLRIRGAQPQTEWGADVKLICGQLWAYEMLAVSGFDANSKYDAEVVARKKAADEDLMQLAEEQQQSDLGGQEVLAGVALYSDEPQARELW